MAANIHPKSPITRDHYAGFGMIIHQFALVDSTLEEAIREMLGLERYQAAFLLTELRHEQKRNMFLALLEKINVTEHRAKQAVKIIERIQSKARLRNHVAHSMWTRGRKPNHIKPMRVTTRKQLKLLGLNHNEQEYSSEDLELAAIEIGQIYEDLKAFIEAGGDYESGSA